MIELKACPFCGGYTEHAVAPDGDDDSTFCDCGASEDFLMNERFDRWNTRPIEDALQKRIAELERTVDDLRGELAQSDRASDAARVAELEAERDKLRDGLERIIAIKNCSIFSDCNQTETCMTLHHISEIAKEALKGGE